MFSFLFCSITCHLFSMTKARIVLTAVFYWKCWNQQIISFLSAYSMISLFAQYLCWLIISCNEHNAEFDKWKRKKRVQHTQILQGKTTTTKKTFVSFILHLLTTFKLRRFCRNGTRLYQSAVHSVWCIMLWAWGMIHYQHSPSWWVESKKQPLRVQWHQGLILCEVAVLSSWILHMNSTLLHCC